MNKSVYLAGPDVFLPNAVEVGREKVAICAEFGFAGLFPLDKEIEDSGNAFAIFEGNRTLMLEADAGLFNLTPFRGPSADVGTVFELGFMHALGKPIFAYSADHRLFVERVSATHGPVKYSSQNIIDRSGYTVERFDLHDNLMLEGALDLANGALFVERDDDSNDLVARNAFRRALTALADYFTCRSGKT